MFFKILRISGRLGLYLVEKIHKLLLSFFLFFRASCLVIFATSLSLLLTCWLSCLQAIK